MLAKPMVHDMNVSNDGRIYSGDALQLIPDDDSKREIDFRGKVRSVSNLFRKASEIRYGYVDSKGIYHLNSEATQRERDKIYEQAIDVLAQLGDDGLKRVDLDAEDGKLVLILDGEVFGRFDFQLPGVDIKSVNHFFMIMPNYKS